MGYRLRVLSESNPMNSNMTGFRWFANIIAVSEYPIFGSVQLNMGYRTCIAIHCMIKMIDVLSPFKQGIVYNSGTTHCFIARCYRIQDVTPTCPVSGGPFDILGGWGYPLLTRSDFFLLAEILNCQGQNVFFLPFRTRIFSHYFQGQIVFPKRITPPPPKKKKKKINNNNNNNNNNNK